MILANLYNKVMGFFRQTEQEEVESAKDTACNRLRVVLMQDRTNLTPELMDRMRKELVELLSKYVEMDKEALDLSLEQDGDQVALMLSIPVIRAKDEDEIADCELRAKDAHGDDTSAEQSVDPLNASNQAKEALAKDDAEKVAEETEEETEEVSDEDGDSDEITDEESDGEGLDSEEVSEEPDETEKEIEKDEKN